MGGLSRGSHRRAAHRRFVWLIAGAVAVVLGLSVAVVVAFRPSAHTKRIADAASASSESTARVIAADYHHPVTIASDTTATAQTEALPTGQLRLTESAGPVRVKQGNVWVPIDATLTKTSDGRVAPKASALPVVFSGGGAGPLETLTQSSGQSFTITAPVSPLPKPVVAGASATYPDIYPGIDLKLTATGAGTSSVLVVKTAAAAANPALEAVTFGFSGAAVSTDSAGDAIVGSGASALVLPSVTWWDSSLKGASASGPVGDVGAKQLSRTVTSSGETMNIAAVTSSAGVAYPLFLGTNSLPPENQVDWGFVQKSAPGNDATSPFWHGTLDPLIDPYYTAHVGYLPGYLNDVNPGVALNAHAMWSFPIPSSVWGTTVGDTALNGFVEHSSVCGASATIDAVSVTGAITAAETWNNQPATGGLLESKPISNAGLSCGATGNGTAIGFNVQSAVAAAASAKASSVGIELQPHSETDANSWRKFGMMSLQITYGNPPSQPTNPHFVLPSVACGTATTPAVVNSASVALELSSTTADADKLNVDDRFFVANAAGANVLPTTIAPLGYLSSGLVKAGQHNVMVPQGALAQGGLYQWYSVGVDVNGASSIPSTSCFFQVVNSNPAAPSVGLAPGQAAPTAVGQLASVRIAGNLTNLAINGGFESGPLGTQTSGWQTDAGATLTGVSGPLAPDQGSGYAVVTSTSATAGIFETIPIYLNAPSTVCASVKISSVSAGTGAVGVLAISANNGAPQRSAQIATVSGQWTLIQSCLDSTMPITTVGIRIYDPVVGTSLAVDSVVLNADLVADGGFNAGNSPWQVAPSSNYVVYGTGSTGTPYDGAGFAATNTTSATGGIYQDASVPVPAGATYCVSALVATQGQASGAAGTMTLTARGGANGAADQTSTASFKNLPGIANGTSWTNWQAEYTCLTVTGSNVYSALRVQFAPTANGPTLLVDSVNLNASTGRLLYWQAPTGTTETTTPVLGALPPGCGAPAAKTGVVLFAQCAGADGSAIITLAPVNSPESTFWVASIDPAGDISPPTPLRFTNLISDPSSSLATAHRWLTDRLVPAAAGTTLPDSALIGPAAQPLTLGAGATWTTSTVVPGTTSTVLHLNGSAAVTGPVSTGVPPQPGAFDSTKSFTVSAWVQPDKTLSTAGSYTVLSQGAPGASSVSLGLVNDRWQFCVSSKQVQAAIKADATGGTTPATGDCVQSTTTVNLAVGAWVMVTGEWDAVNQELRLFVGLSTAQVIGHAAPQYDSAAPGPFTIGFSSGGVAATHWIGNIDDVWVVQATLDSGQLADLGQQPRNSDLTSW